MKTTNWIIAKILLDMDKGSPLNFGSHPNVEPDMFFLKEFYHCGIWYIGSAKSC